MRCFKCNNVLVPAVAHEPHQPYAGTTFVAYGQYGSTVWDPMPIGHVTPFLEIYICDVCLLANVAQVRKGERIPRGNDYVYSPWDPEQG